MPFKATHLLCWNTGFPLATTLPPPAHREGCTPEAALLRLTALLPPPLPPLLLLRRIELGPGAGKRNALLVPHVARKRPATTCSADLLPMRRPQLPRTLFALLLLLLLLASTGRRAMTPGGCMTQRNQPSSRTLPLRPLRDDTDVFPLIFTLCYPP